MDTKQQPPRRTPATALLADERPSTTWTPEPTKRGAQKKAQSRNNIPMGVVCECGVNPETDFQINIFTSAK